jgi:hypothetical protein
LVIACRSALFAQDDTLRFQTFAGEIIELMFAEYFVVVLTETRGGSSQRALLAAQELYRAGERADGP